MLNAIVDGHQVEVADFVRKNGRALFLVRAEQPVFCETSRAEPDGNGGLHWYSPGCSFRTREKWVSREHIELLIQVELVQEVEVTA